MGTRANPAGSTAQPAPDIQTQKPFVAFQPGNVPPSQAVYLQLNDVIFIKHLANVNFAPCSLNYRYLTPQGEIKEGVKPIFPAAVGQIDSFNLGEAWLLTIVLQPAATPGAGSWCYVQIGIARGIPVSSTAPFQGLIWEGYVAQNGVNGWPGVPSKEIWDGAGSLRTITGSTPAAGADISESVPNNRRWNLLSFHATLSTSATVANRQPTFTLDDGLNTFFFGEPLFSTTASLVVHFSANPNIPSQASLVSFSLFCTLLLPIQLRAPFRIRTSTNGIQAGDQWSAPQYLVQEWGSWEV